MKSLAAMLFLLGAICVTTADTEDFVICEIRDDYDQGAVTCYVDSVNGSDANDGLSESTPVRSQSAIHSGCTVVRFRRGSVFNEKLAIPTPFNNVRFGYNVKVYTNYGPRTDPLPHFRVSSLPGRGPVVLSFSPLTIDGLHFSGARGDNTMEHDFDFDGDGITKGIVGGIGAFLGAATTFINNEIDDCDIGIMLGAPGSAARGNYVHDLIMGIDDDPGVDPNLVGGAEGIFVNASNCEVSYNTFINCTGPARWVGSNGTCDGGATEVSAASGGSIENVHIHHNFSYNSCGFFEVASYFGDEGKGRFKDSSLHNNLIVDSAWMGLLQVNNTDLENIHFYNNTLIQRPGSLNAGILWIIFTSTSSGMEGGELVPGTVHLTNNLYVLDGVTSWFRLIDPAFVTKNNIVLSYSGPEDPGYMDIGFANIAGTTAPDFDLVKAGSPAVNAGAAIAGNPLDYFNRARPAGGAPDIGAMEFGSTQVECLPPAPPVLETASVTSIRAASATGGGEVLSTGGEPVIARGVCWSTSANPGRHGACALDGAGTGVFTGRMTGLSPETTYHVRAFAESTVGTAYGRDVTFTTASLNASARAGLTVWRPATGVWYALGGGSAPAYTATQWGVDGDVPVSGDYDGDGRSDLAVWRPGSGVWYLRPSGTTGYTATSWGTSGDIPVPADYDGDGRTDIAVWRPGSGVWYLRPSGAAGYTATSWGTSGDIPVPADYDGDGKSDLAVFRPGNGIWYIRKSGGSGGYVGTQWGAASDIPVPGDCDADGKADVAVWRPATGVWYIRPSAAAGYTATAWGTSGDTPVSGDYDGDGKYDVAVFRPGNGIWYVRSSAVPGSYTTTKWGAAGDIPISPVTGILNSIP